MFVSIKIHIAHDPNLCNEMINWKLQTERFGNKLGERISLM